MTFENAYRSPTDWEQRLIARLLTAEFPGRTEITEQFKYSFVKTIDREGSLAFQLRTKILAPVEKQIPVEAEAKDTDGQRIHVLLHVVNGRAVELEIYKEDRSPIQQLPPPQDWDVLTLPTSPSAGWLRTRLT